MTTNKVVLKAKFRELSQIVDKILQICWNDLKFSHVIYDSTQIENKKFNFAQCYGICGIPWN